MLLSLAALAAARPRQPMFDTAAAVAYDNTTAGVSNYRTPEKVAKLHASMAADVTYSLESSYDYTNWINSFNTEALGVS
jgi:hypothetical protein